VVTAVLGLPACSSDTSGGPGASVAHSRYIAVATGSYRGADWVLFGWEQQSQLCLELLPGGTDPDHPPEESPPSGFGSAGCGFNGTHPGSGWFTSGVGPAGSGVSFGPLPTTAMQIRVATHEVLPTQALPPGTGLPRGRFWIQFQPSGWPTAADGTALEQPQPLDPRGDPVPYQDF
jgi:hypothetical protein